MQSFGKKYRSKIFSQFLKITNEYNMLSAGDVIGVPSYRSELVVAVLEEYKRASGIDFSFKPVDETCNKYFDPVDYDDIAETILDGMLSCGELKTLLPVEKRDGILVMRPFSYIRRESVQGWLKNVGIEEKERPSDALISHKDISGLLTALQTVNPFAISNIVSATYNVNLDGIIGYTDNEGYHHFCDTYDDFVPTEWMKENYHNDELPRPKKR